MAAQFARGREFSDKDLFFAGASSAVSLGVNSYGIKMGGALSADVLEPVGVTTLERSGQIPEFTSQKSLSIHFAKHGGNFYEAYSTEYEYLRGARDAMRNGIKVQYEYTTKLGITENRIGYIRFMGNRSNGISKFEFVGTNTKEEIATYHVKRGKDFWKTINGDPRNKVIVPYAIEDELILRSSLKP